MDRIKVIISINRAKENLEHLSDLENNKYTAEINSLQEILNRLNKDNHIINEGML